MDINRLTQSQIQSTPTPRPESVPVPKPPEIVETSSAQPSRAGVDTIVTQSESKVRSGSRVHIDEATKQVVIEIVNSENEVIRQIPLEEALRLDVLFKRITGIIFDQQA